MGNRERLANANFDTSGVCRHRPLLGFSRPPDFNFVRSRQRNSASEWSAFAESCGRVVKSFGWSADARIGGRMCRNPRHAKVLTHVGSIVTAETARVPCG